MTVIYWAKAANGFFNDNTKWQGDSVPDYTLDAALEAKGADYTVTVIVSETVRSLRMASNSTLQINTGTFQTLEGSGSGALDGTIIVSNGGGLQVGGTMKGGGEIEVDDPQLTIAAATTLTGFGTVSLTDAPGNIIQGQSSTDVLYNYDDIIEGSGALGNGTLSLDNEAYGKIEATGASNPLIIDTAGVTFLNAGLVEAIGKAGLVIQGTLVNNGTGGTLFADGSTLSLENADIVGGILEVAHGGVIQTVPVSDGGSTLDGTLNKVINDGVFDLQDGTYLTLEGSIDNVGHFLLQGATSNTVLTIGANTSLFGGGLVAGDDGAADIITGSALTDVFTNLDNTIFGSFQLGSGLTMVNRAKGVIDAADAGAKSLINTGAGTLTNSGLIEATAGGVLEINSTIRNNPGGKIEASGGGILVELGNAVVIGGTLGDSGGGVIETVQVNDQGSTIDGTKGAVTLAGNLTISDGTYLTLQGAIDNTGRMELDGGSDRTAVVIGAAGLTLSGGGKLVLSNGGFNQIYGAASASVFINQGDTIVGGGQLFDGDLRFVNKTGGVVDGDLAAALVLSTPGLALTNTGVIEATGKGGVVIQNTAVAGSGGVLRAATGSSLGLVDSTVTGNELSTAVKGVITIGDGSRADIQGSQQNGGTIALAGTAVLRILSEGASLSGGGKITLSGGQVVGVSATSTMTNEDNAIIGTGMIGAGKLIFDNEAAGLVEATGGGLTLDTSTHTIANAGTIEAWTGSTLEIKSAVSNTGMLATDFGTLTLDKSVTGAGTGQIDGGTLLALSTFNEDVTFTGASGVLELAHSRSYTGKVSGLSTTGQSSLDLLDITFISTAQTTASFVDNGSMTGGVLTVTDGTHTARITLVGDYAGQTFETASDGHGGTTIVDPRSAPVVHAFAQASAALASVAGPAHAAEHGWAREAATRLTAPRISIG